MKWAIQSTHTNAGMANKLAMTVQRLGMEAVPVWMAKNAEALPDIDVGIYDPVIFYGSTRLVALASASDFIPAVFFSRDSFSHEKHVEDNGPMMLNHDHMRLKIKDTPTANKWGFPYFIKSVELKRLTGMVIFSPESKEALASCDPDMEVIVAPAQNILWEARCFMIGHRIISAAQYRPERSPVSDNDMDDIAGFLGVAQMPEEVCVADVCRLSDGTLRIVEFNCFNSSGFYEHHDMEAVVREVSEYGLTPPPISRRINP